MGQVFNQTSRAGTAMIGGGSLLDRALEVAEVAASEADIVDRNAVFPRAAIEAARRNKLFSLLVPTEYGGEAASVSDICEICFTIAGSCASSAMIIAMHHAALACVVRHRQSGHWSESLLRRIVADELLLASSTTEGHEGGNVRSSSAPIVYTEDGISLTRAATVISYGAEADAIVTTARRAADCPSSDQVLAVILKRDYTITQTNTWQTLGMRGTRSAGFALTASAPERQILPVPYKTIHAQTMVPISHLVWCSVWTGIAAAAVARARDFVRASARRADGRMPPGALNHAKALASLNGLRARLSQALSDFEEMSDDLARLEAIQSQAAFQLLKVEISEGALATVGLAMRACGLAGYREDGEFSIARHLRDILSAPIMIHNERILSNVAAAALMSPTTTSLRHP